MDCAIFVVIIAVRAVGQFIKDEAGIAQLWVIFKELAVLYEIGKQIVLFIYALAILFLEPVHFRALAFGKRFAAGHTGLPLVRKLGEPLIPALAPQVCVSVPPVLHPRIVNLKAPLAVPAAEPARFLPNGLGVDVAPLHLLRGVQRLKVGIGRAASAIAVPLALRRPRRAPRRLLGIAAVLAVSALLDRLASNVPEPLGVSAEGVDSGVGVGVYLLLHARERGFKFRSVCIGRKVNDAVQLLNIDFYHALELFVPELLADTFLDGVVRAGILSRDFVVGLVLGYLLRADAHIVRLDDDSPVFTPDAADAARAAVGPVDLERAEDVLDLLAGAPVHVLSRSLELVVPLLLGEDAHRGRVRALGHAQFASAYFFEPKISCTILSLKRCSALFKGRGPSFCAFNQLSSLSAGTSTAQPSSVST